jgi:hypothetical protein
MGKPPQTARETPLFYPVTDRAGDDRGKPMSGVQGGEAAGGRDATSRYLPRYTLGPSVFRGAAV